MATTNLYNPALAHRVVGTVVLCSRVAGSDARPARRLVNADGSPRTDLVAVRVIRFQPASRRLTADAIVDGARPMDIAICEVL